MTDEIQNLPVSEAAPKTRRPRRSAAKTTEKTAASTGESPSTSNTSPKTDTKPNPGSEKASDKAPEKSPRAKNSSPRTASKTAKSPATDSAEAEPAAAPKPRSRRRPSPKAASEDQASPAADSEKAPAKRAPRRSTKPKTAAQPPRQAAHDPEQSAEPPVAHNTRAPRPAPVNEVAPVSEMALVNEVAPRDAALTLSPARPASPTAFGAESATMPGASAHLDISITSDSSLHASAAALSSLAAAPRPLAVTPPLPPADVLPAAPHPLRAPHGATPELPTVGLSDLPAPAPQNRLQITPARTDSAAVLSSSTADASGVDASAAPFAAPNFSGQADFSDSSALSGPSDFYDQTDHSDSSLAEDNDPQGQAAAENGETPPRKSRRGRRGGRGRSKNKAREAAALAENRPEIPLQDEDDDDFAPRNSFDDDDSRDDDSREDSVERRGAARPSRPGRGLKKELLVEPAPDKDAVDKSGRRKMFISVVPGEQVEVALVEEGAIHEYYLEMLHQAKTKGNIYKGVIHNIDTNLQAAFVNYGANKNGFLQIDEVHPEYYLTHHESMKGKKFPPMQKVLKAGQEVLVQVVKEPSGTKGAFLTTWLSLAGRFLVLTPGQEQIGVSRKVENDEERARLREMMNGIDPGEGLGVIVRTVSAGTSKTTLKNDLQYLKRLWKDIRKRGTSEPTPSLIYQEPGLAERAVRDYLTDDVCEVWVDDGPVADSLRETVALLFPRKEDLVRVHNDLRQTLWERFNIQRQLEQIYSREVILPSGGRLVFDQTEALMAIDINSGKISGKGNFEAMALKTNVEAAECIARQLKLRDIGGQIVIDFIEMRDKNHIRDVEKTLRNAMKNDRARHDVGRMSSFGLLEIVRQRTASSALAITMEPCPACGGTGLRRNIEWQALQSIREIARQARVCGPGPCQVELSAELGLYLLNHKRAHLREMEKQHNVPIEITIRP